MWRIGKRNTIQVAEVQGSYEVDWNSLDDLIDAGLTAEPVRGFPERWTGETVGVARQIFAERVLTEYRACELAISVVYVRHKYAPTWNAPLFPERDIAAKAKLKRDNAKSKKSKKQRGARSADGNSRQGDVRSQPSAYRAA